MKRIFLALLLVGSFSAMAKDVCTEGDALPWPWGTECPFPWGGFDGNWEVVNHEAGETFSFTVLNVDRFGRRTFGIRRYNSTGDLVGEGKGVASKRRKIIRAFISSIQESKKKNYWALVRAYSEQERFDCNPDHIAVVLTLRTTRPKTCEKDQHFIIRKTVAPNEDSGDI